ncbi:MAG: type II toxin-antitoxin system HicB family antitoxin [Vulcanibacillus sp.]
MKNAYIFLAIFDYTDDGISIEFPDLPGCLTAADTTEEATKNAKEVLGLFLWGMEKDNEEIPESTPINKLKLESNQIPFLVEVWMPIVRNEMDKKAIKKTLTIPQWLNIMAENNNINFSQTLQQALKEQLGINEQNQNRA